MNTHTDIRPSPIAGQWYPAEPARLASKVDGYIDNAQLPQLPGQVVAIMVPHAGHPYSGPVAGYAFAALRGMRPDVVIVVSPMHYPYAEPLLTTAHAAYGTPLGAIAVDKDALKELDDRLHDSLGFGLSPVARDPEHSLEIELPFLQRALSQPFKLVPVMIREQSLVVAEALGKALAYLITDGQSLQGRSVLLVASTDLSHFYPEQMANQLDSQMLHQVEALDPAGVIRTEEEGKGFACGRGALAAVLWAAKELGATHSTILNHATSADVTGDFDRVVGYGAAVITK
jgi:MEMO1 family protein